MPSVIGSEGGSNLHSTASGGASGALATEKKSIKVLCSHCEKILVPIETEGELSSLELEQCIFYMQNALVNPQNSRYEQIE